MNTTRRNFFKIAGAALLAFPFAAKFPELKPPVAPKLPERYGKSIGLESIPELQKAHKEIDKKLIEAFRKELIRISDQTAIRAFRRSI
tara:strand:+ start:359 stop:622 length:264 start_codon:yes stop_codon:yes gene_type:complete